MSKITNDADITGDEMVTTVRGAIEHRATWMGLMCLEAKKAGADAAAATLATLAANQDIPALYRDLAAFKAAILPNEDNAARMTTLQQLGQPGQPFRLLALEQIAYLQLDAGDTAAAIATLRQVEEDAAVTQGLRERVQTLMVALGEPLPASVTE